MADLLSRQPLFEGSASLFTDEKITNARVKVRTILIPMVYWPDTNR